MGQTAVQLLALVPPTVQIYKWHFKVQMELADIVQINTSIVFLLVFLRISVIFLGNGRYA